MPGDRIRLLAIDGGGVRGLSSLMILQQLMATVDPESTPKPCEYFDMIGGTSTGGLIAIILGRLRMTVDDCIDAYISLSDKVFEKKSYRVTVKGKLQGRFDTAELERAVKQILVDRSFDKDALLKDSPNAPCKVYVYTDSSADAILICQLRLRDQQTDHRHRLSDYLPISPRRHPPTRFDQNMAGLPRHVRRHVLRSHCHRAL
jgi:predicted acylesterase/phospholipase RssA